MPGVSVSYSFVSTTNQSVIPLRNSATGHNSQCRCLRMVSLSLLADLTPEEQQLLLDIRRKKAQLLQEIQVSGGLLSEGGNEGKCNRLGWGRF